MKSKSIFFSALLISLLFLFAFYSCNIDDKRYEMLLGEWYGSSWIIDDSQREYDASQVHFHFMEENEYTAQLGNREEVGTYRLVDRMLYTDAEGQSEMAVRLIYIDHEMLRLGMNRGGQLETLTLKREPMQ